MMKIFNTQRKQDGFTLIELLVVIAIIGVLSGLLFSNFVGIRERSRDGARKSDLRQIQAALELYRSDQGEYPTEEDLSACGGSLKDPNDTVIYMQKIPCDQSGESVPYTYFPDSDNVTYKLIACLENENDSQKATPDELTDLGVTNPCNQEDNFAYVLQNP